MVDEDLYGDLAGYYDYIYHWKDYEDDVKRLEEFIEAHGTSSGNALMDIGCGTGNHLVHLVDAYDCVGLDCSREMLALASEKLPDVELIMGDMKDFDLGKRFDVIISMFSTMGYAKTLKDMDAVTGNIARHLSTGGVAIVEPWLSKDDIKPRYVGMHTYDSDDLKIARLGRIVVEGETATFEAHYLIAEDGDIRHVVDKHRLSTYGEDEIVRSLKDSGLDAWFVKDGFALGRGAVIAVKR